MKILSDEARAPSRKDIGLEEWKELASPEYTDITVVHGMECEIGGKLEKCLRDAGNEHNLE